MSVEKIPGKKSNWRYRFTPKGSNKRISKSGFRTKSEAKRAEAKARLEWESKDSYKESRTFNSVFEEWFELKKESWQPNTLRNASANYRNHIQEVFGDRDIADISYREMQNFFINLPLAKSSQISVRSLFNMVFTYAVRCGLMENNPAQYIECSDHPVHPQSELRYIDQGRFRWLIEQFKDNQDVLLSLMIGYYTGLRRSEIFGLRWEDFDGSWIHLQRQATAHKFETKEILKTKGSKTDIYMPEVLRNFIEPYKKEEGFIFSTWHKGCENVVKKVWPEFHYHALRHTFISNVVPYADPKTAMALARHTTAQMTFEVYAHSNKENKIKTVDEAFKDDELDLDADSKEDS